jgi:uncharacterized protein (DUF58 family)
MAGVSQSAPIAFSKRLSAFLHGDLPEVWIRFLLALVGLTLAFGAALFSTVARESGSFWTTLIFASGALLLAVIVGLTTVPYLAKRVAGRHIRDAFDYEVTRAGIIYVGVVLLIGIAALNTGNNLLYIIVAAMLSAIVVSGVASAMVLRNLELDVRLPEHVFARQPVLGKIILRNRGKWLSSFSVSVISSRKVKGPKRWQWQASTFGWPPGRPPGAQWIHLPDRKLRRLAADSGSPGIFEGSVYFPYLPRGAELTSSLDLCFPHRGRYQQESFLLSTRFPFAFLAKTRRIPCSREIIVYPSIAPPHQLPEILPLIRGEFETFMRGRGSDLYRIREYLPEDSARHVDWKATAKSGSLKVREFSREDQRKLRIIFDNPQPGMLSSEAYEKAVALAASLGWQLAGANSETSFLSQDYRGSPDVCQFLAHLAMIRPRESASILESLTPTDGYSVILTTRGRNTIPASLSPASYFVFLGGNG